MSETNGTGTTALATAEHPPVAMQRWVPDVAGLKKRVEAVRTLQKEVLREGVDYGVIPGTGDKPTLLKPGAESLLAAFGLGVGELQIDERAVPSEVPGHVEYTVRAPIVNQATGLVVGWGVGYASTMESKHRYRNASRVCPKCGKEAIQRSKNDGEGWYCWRKKDGCGAQFAVHDQAISSQSVGRIENQDPSDQRNSVLKTAKKRALVDGALTTCAASGVFTQDIEDTVDDQGGNYSPPPQQAQRPNVQRQSRQQPQAQQPAELRAVASQHLVLTKITRKNGQSEGYNAYATTADGREANWVSIWHTKSFKDICQADHPEQVNRIELVADIVVRQGNKYPELENLYPLGEDADWSDIAADEVGPPIEDAPPTARGDH